MLTVAVFGSEFLFSSFCLFMLAKVPTMNVYFFCYKKPKKKNPSYPWFHIQIKCYFFHSLGFSSSLQSKETLLLLKHLFLLFRIIVICNFPFLFRKFSFSSLVPWGQGCILLFFRACRTFSIVPATPHTVALLNTCSTKLICTIGCSPRSLPVCIQCLVIITQDSPGLPVGKLRDGSALLIKQDTFQRACIFYLEIKALSSKEVIL